MTYENKSCMKDSCFLTLQIKLWRKYNGKKIEYALLSVYNADNWKVFESLIYEYIDEMNEHSERPLPK